MKLKSGSINKGLSHLSSAIIALQQFRNCVEGENRLLECVVGILTDDYQSLEGDYLKPGLRPENVPERAPSTITP